MVIVTGYMLFMTSHYDVLITFAKQCFSEVCWHKMHIILHALSLLVVQYVTVLNINYHRSTLGNRSKTQDSSLRQSRSMVRRS